jgi:hypothetical protein
MVVVLQSQLVLDSYDTKRWWTPNWRFTIAIAFWNFEEFKVIQQSWSNTIWFGWVWLHP